MLNKLPIQPNELPSFCKFGKQARVMSSTGSQGLQVPSLTQVTQTKPPPMKHYISNSSNWHIVNAERQTKKEKNRPFRSAPPF